MKGGSGMLFCIILPESDTFLWSRNELLVWINKLLPPSIWLSALNYLYVCLQKYNFRYNVRAALDTLISVCVGCSNLGNYSYVYWYSFVRVFVMSTASRWQCNPGSGGNREWKRVTSKWAEGDTMVVKRMIVCDISALTVDRKLWRYSENVFELTRFWIGLLRDARTVREICRVSRK